MEHLSAPVGGQDPLDALTPRPGVARRAQPTGAAMDDGVPGVECITSEASLRALAPHWRALHAGRADLTPFNSFEWLWSWWQAYGVAGALRVLVFRDGRTLVGIVPLRMSREHAGPARGCRVLRFVGDGSFDSDHLGIIAAPGRDAEVVERLGTWLRASRGWDVLCLRDLSEASALPDALRALATRDGLFVRVERTRCAVLELPASFDAFLRERQARFRTKVRSLLKRLDDDGLVVEWECDAAALRRRLRSLFALHQMRWQAAGGPGVFADARRRRFYAHFVPRFCRAGWLRLYSLRRGDSYVAHQLCFGGGGVTYLLQEGFDVTDTAASYGQMLRAAVVRELIRRGERRYDFLGGFSRHKEDWGAREGVIDNVVLARRGWRGRWYFHLPALREAAAQKALRWLPPVAVRALRRLTRRGA